MSAQIQRELEATRAEVRRGAIELPQETQEATANMRRVVADQIKALNELSALVSRSSRAVDAAPPAPPRRVSEPAAGIAAELRPTQGPSPAPAPAPRLAEAPPPPCAGDAPARAGAADAAAGAAAVRRCAAAEPAPEARAGSEQGWLSNLLTRASQDEEAEDAAARAGAPERAPAEALNSLDAISVDIARMIDHEAAVDLWDRYSRGERNVFTRAPLHAPGPADLRRDPPQIPPRSASSSRPSTAMSRSSSALSRRSARNDRDRTLARTYLTSETGKVYTMLAHASGRFD